MDNTIENSHLDSASANKNRVILKITFGFTLLFGGLIVWSILVKDWESLPIEFSFFLGCIGEILSKMDSENSKRRLAGKYILKLSIVLILIALALRIY